MPRRFRRFLAVDLSVLAVLVVVLAGLLLTGRAAIVTTHGVSMNPVYYQGDLVLVARKPSYRVGQIVAYRVPGQDVVVLHRIVGGDSTGYVFQGDNNQSTDPTTPRGDQLIGTAVLHISHGGVWFQRATSPPAIGAFAFLLLVGGGTAARTRRRRSRGSMSRPAHRSPSGPTPPPRIFRAAPPFSAAAGVAGAAASILVVGLVLGAVAWTRPDQRTERVEHSVDQQLTFGYQTAVRRSPAYDTTTVTEPDPVFRRLSNMVDVRVRYRGEPASVAVDATLSTLGGWHSTLPLTPRTASSTRHDLVIHLDLVAIDARAQRAAATTGITFAQVDIAVVARVVTPDGAVFAPALHLTLTPLQLSLADGEASLTAQGQDSTSQVIHVPATLSILGRKVGVASARMVSAALLFGSLLVLALLLVLGLVARPRAEGDAIRRRYWPLLVPVHPMPAPIGRPVVDVPDFNTLVKVAQRYGLLVMHWARAGIETFVVQDDAITYRYRTGAAGPISEHNPKEGWASPADPATPVVVDDVEPAAVAPRVV